MGLEPGRRLSQVSGSVLYEPRESINLRAFALRHALLDEIRFRRAGTVDATRRDALSTLARVIEVSYDAPSRSFVVQAADARVDVPLRDFRFYEARADASTAGAREDVVLSANRARAAALVDTLLGLMTEATKAPE